MPRLESETSTIGLTATSLTQHIHNGTGIIYSPYVPIYSESSSYLELSVGDMKLSMNDLTDLFTLSDDILKVEEDLEYLCFNYRLKNGTPLKAIETLLEGIKEKNAK